MNAFSRSWQIVKLSLEVIKKDKELIAFPILSGIFSIAFMIAMVLPYAFYSIKLNISAGSEPAEALLYLVIFILYFGLAFVATFFNVCTVYTIKKRFSGGNATFMESIKFGLSKIHIVFSWSLLAATVGLILRLLDRIGDRMGQFGQVIMRIITSILGASWGIITIFVVPAMVYKSVGPIDAIKASARTLKKAWGESLVRVIGVGLASLAFYIIGAVFWLAMFYLFAPLGGGAIVVILILALSYFILVATVFSLINSVFNTALYVYAETGKVPAFKEEVLKGAFGSKR
jgi:hypothetical protein